MFYKNLIKGKKSVQKDLVFDVFQNFVDKTTGESKQQLKEVKNTYNFNVCDGELTTGLGFKKLQMPTSSTEPGSEEILQFDGSKVYAIWSFKWYDINTHGYKYYMLYYNDNNNLGLTNLFAKRPIALYITTPFTQVPTGCNTRHEEDDAIVFSSLEEKGLFLVTGSQNYMYERAPQVQSICCLYNTLFAITTDKREKLFYSSNQDLTQWTEDDMSQIQFNDDLGGLNKVVDFNDYVYVFRDFGINKISFYSTKDTFDISQIHKADSYIYPGTIASSGDRIYFLEGGGIFSFNGSSANKVELDYNEILNKSSKDNATAVCFEGKYYLACRYDFDDNQKIGCEKEEGFVNNVLFVFDTQSKQINVLRGVDIKQLCVLNNPYKSKVVACFNGQHIGNVGELSMDGQVFGQASEKVWTSVYCDMGYADKIKKTKYLTIKTQTDCLITITSDQMSKTYDICGSDKIQQVKVDVFGKEMSVSIGVKKQEAKISNVKLVFDVI